MKLYTADNNHIYTVKSAPDLALLNTLGVFEGSKIMKKATYSLGGPVLIDIDGREVAIGKDLAVVIEVELCEVQR